MSSSQHIPNTPNSPLSESDRHSRYTNNSIPRLPHMSPRNIRNKEREDKQKNERSNMLNRAFVKECGKLNPDIERIRTLLRRGVNVNAHDKHNWTGLLWACRRNHINIVRHLLQAGARVNIRDIYGRSVFDYAKRKPEILKLLLNTYNTNKVKIVQKAFRERLQPKIRQKQLNEKLLKECCKSTPNILTISNLIHKGANKNTKDKDGNTPLILVCIHSTNPLDTVKLLIRFGANVNVRGEDGVTALMQACTLEHINTVKVLLRAGANMRIKDNRGENVFNYIFAGDPEMTKLLYVAKYNTMSPTNKNIRNKKVRVIQKVFRQKQLNKKLLKECGTYRPNISTIRSLLEAGANVNARDTDGNTPLVEACGHGSLKIIELLLDHGAKINVRNQHGFTPLLYCLNYYLKMQRYGKQRGDILNVVKLLVQRGANIYAKTRDGQNALQLSKRNTHQYIENLFIEKKYKTMGVRRRGMRNIAARSIQEAFRERLQPKIQRHTNAASIIQRKFRERLQSDIQRRIQTRRSKATGIIQKVFRQKQLNQKLLKECQKENPSIAVIGDLIHLGADVNARDKWFEHWVATPLIYACSTHSIDTDVLKLLIEAGANVNIRCEGQNALMSAMSYGCDIDTIKILLRAGTDVNIKDDDGQTVFDYAKNKPEILKLLYARKYKTVFYSKRNINNVRAIQSVVRRHRATNKNSRLSINAITLEHIPRRNSIALNGQMYHRNSIASLVALGNARVPHSRRRIVTGANGRYTTT